MLLVCTKENKENTGKEKHTKKKISLYGKVNRKRSQGQLELNQIFWKELEKTLLPL